MGNGEFTPHETQVKFGRLKTWRERPTSLRLPRLILNPAVRPWIFLWQRERRDNARLRREVVEWQNKLLAKVNVTPLFTPPPKPVEQVERPPVGLTAKKAYVKAHAGPNAVPTTEDILLAAERVHSNGK
jgi:hypothetical protein